MTGFEIIRNSEFEMLLKTFDDRIDYLKTQFCIELKSYGNILRTALNNLQSESLSNLLERLNINRELERALENAGGYTIDFLNENNAKTGLKNVIDYLKGNQIKLNQLVIYINSNDEKRTIIADNNDIDFLNQIFPSRRINIISLTELKRHFQEYRNLVFYSFNGRNDFDFVYNLQADVSLILFEQEYQLYQKQLQKRKHLIEEEIKSKDRNIISGITYEPIPDLPIHISNTIENIVNRLDELGQKAYDNYKDETDSILEEIEDKVIYRTKLSNDKTEFLESNETVFNSTGDLIKAYRIKVDDKIRIYPREHFAEKLYQVAVETDQEVFSKVEEHSKYWLSILQELKIIHSLDLYPKLKSNGIKVLSNTVECYFNGQRKFPMYNNDLKAIFKLKHPEKSESEIDLILSPIRKSKTAYNSTMIALGKGIKQEIKLYLKEKGIGQIISKLKFTAITLQIFIDEFMPLVKITEKEIYSHETEQLELFNLLQQF